MNKWASQTELSYHSIIMPAYSYIHYGTCQAVLCDTSGIIEKQANTWLRLEVEMTSYVETCARRLRELLSTLRQNTIFKFHKPPTLFCLVCKFRYYWVFQELTIIDFHVLRTWKPSCNNSMGISRRTNLESLPCVLLHSQLFRFGKYLQYMFLFFCSSNVVTLSKCLLKPGVWNDLTLPCSEV